MKRVGQPSNFIKEAKISDTIYNKRQKLYGKVTRRTRCNESEPKLCHSCKLNGEYFDVDRLDGRGQGSWCYGLWEEI